ncbi:hypothetical protein [Streptomyces sp. NPDC049813]|uniref:hypothetical protein n=1 Tax=Streptomyces sp. NPDC049813 TaxID=3365597 RepID=UPI00379CEC62
MSRTPRVRTAAVLLACAVLTGLAGCGGDGGEPRRVGTLLDRTDDAGHRYRQVRAEGAPEVGVVVQPDPDPARGWDVRIRVRHFRLSPPGTPAAAVRGRGYVQLSLDGRRLARLHGTAYRLPAARVGRGTHHVTARLHADDATVWSVEGTPVEATADLTSSGTETAPAGDPDASGTGRTTGGDADASGTGRTTGGDADASGTGTATAGDPDASGTGTATGGDADASGTGRTTGGDADASGTETAPAGAPDASGTETAPAGDPDASGTKAAPVGAPGTSGAEATDPAPVG